MSRFNDENFTYDGMYLMYVGEESGERHFVARFKRGGMAEFRRFLIANFTKEEYFQELVVNRVPPLKILESKGFVSSAVKRLLKQCGYTPDITGYKAYIANSVARYAK